VHPGRAADVSAAARGAVEGESREWADGTAAPGGMAGAGHATGRGGSARPLPAFVFDCSTRGGGNIGGAAGMHGCTYTGWAYMGWW